LISAAVGGALLRSLIASRSHLRWEGVPPKALVTSTSPAFAPVVSTPPLAFAYCNGSPTSVSLAPVVPGSSRGRVYPGNTRVCTYVLCEAQGTLVSGVNKPPNKQTNNIGCCRRAAVASRLQLVRGMNIWIARNLKTFETQKFEGVNMVEFVRVRVEGLGARASGQARENFGTRGSHGNHNGQHHPSSLQSPPPLPLHQRAALCGRAAV
jgi:hypothetical protein